MSAHWTQVVGTSAVILIAYISQFGMKLPPGRVENGYYSDLDLSLQGDALKSELHNRIKQEQVVLRYREAWTALESIGRGRGGCSDASIYDVYTGQCWLPIEQRCARTNNSAGVCYNREHVWPKSWYGGFEKGRGAETDLISLFTVDGFVNSVRSNFPYGEVTNATRNFSTGARIGSCHHSTQLQSHSSRVRGRVQWFSEAKGYGYVAIQNSKDAFVHISDVENKKKLLKGQAVECELAENTEGHKGPKCVKARAVVDTCFEPPDRVKGDLARAIFYVSVRYLGQLECCQTDAVDAHRINKWLEDVLRRWHEQDAVDDEERARNELIFARWQRNRNPFVDHPKLVSQINDF